jgi:hypothetical protein
MLFIEENQAVMANPSDFNGMLILERWQKQ